MKNIAKIILFLLVSADSFGQLSPVTSQYILNPILINPAYAGNRGALNVAAFYRKQWVGISGSPETMTLSADAPFFDDRVGFGLSIQNDKYGVTKQTQIVTNYSYVLKMKKGTLSFGLGAGLTTTNTKWSDLIVIDPGDELYLADSHVYVVPNFSFGAVYTYKNYFAGFSIPRILGYEFNSVKNKYNLSINPGNNGYMFSGGSIYDITPKLKFRPSLLITFSPGEKLLYDLNAHINYKDKLWTGLSYRSGRALSALIQIKINTQLRMAYSYDFDFGKLRTYSSGSHEIMLRYEFNYKVDVVNPLVF
jgi:type IX secretion system PorP/SprF family membrane protein